MFCKRSRDLQHVGSECHPTIVRARLFRPAQTGSQKQVTAPKHCSKCWLCECVSLYVCICDKKEREKNSLVPEQIQKKTKTKLSVTSATQSCKISKWNDELTHTVPVIFKHLQRNTVFLRLCQSSRMYTCGLIKSNDRNSLSPNAVYSGFLFM